MDVGDVAAFPHMSGSQVYKLLVSGSLHAVRIGGLARFTRYGIAAFVRSDTAWPASKPPDKRPRGWRLTGPAASALGARGHPRLHQLPLSAQDALVPEVRIGTLPREQLVVRPCLLHLPLCV